MYAVFGGEAPELSHTSNEKNKRCFLPRSCLHLRRWLHNGRHASGKDFGASSIACGLWRSSTEESQHRLIQQRRWYNEREGRLSVRCRVPRGSTVALQAQVQHGSRCGRLQGRDGEMLVERNIFSSSRVSQQR